MKRHDEETRRKISESVKKTWKDPQVLAKRAKSERERRRKIGETMRNHWQDPTFKKKRLEALNHALQNPIIRKKQLNATRRAAKNRDRIEKISETSRERWRDPQYHQRVSASLRKANQSPRMREKRREDTKRLWKNPQFREKVVARICAVSQEISFKEKCSKASQKRWKKPQARKRASETCKEWWANLPLHARTSHIKRVMSAMLIKPNQQEVKLQKLLEKVLFHEYRYVGDGGLILGGRCPDFMNVNGQKKLIELYGDYWHQDDDPQTRIDFFKRFGFDTLVVWEHELADTNTLTEKILRFNNGGSLCA